MLNLSGVINMKLYYYRSSVLYESEISLVKPFAGFMEKYSNLSLNDDKIIRSDMKLIRKKPNKLLKEQDVLKELKYISESDIIDFSNLYNLMISKENINTQKLRDLIKDYLSYFSYFDSVCYSKEEECGILRLERSDYLNSCEYAKNISTAYPNTLLLNDLGIEKLDEYQLTLKH